MGGKSSLNPKSMGSAFPFIDGKNYIRGDTEVLGHVTNSGSITSDRVRVGHSSGQDDSRLSVVAAAGKNGASFGGPGGLFSHLPYNDNNTYIRPGREGSSVYVGDVGASVVSIGKGDTNVNVRGPLTIYDKSGQKKLTMQSDGSIQINGTLRVCDTNGSRCKTI
jgi:hypothetical protein